MLHEEPTQFADVPPASLIDDEDARGKAFATALIGNCCVKALAEVRRLDFEARAAYAAESESEDRVLAACRPDRSDYHAVRTTMLDIKATKAAADEAGFRYVYALTHAAALPILKPRDIEAKAFLAIEHGDYLSDLEIGTRVLCQIVDFCRKAFAS